MASELTREQVEAWLSIERGVVSDGAAWIQRGMALDALLSAWDTLSGVIRRAEILAERYHDEAEKECDRWKAEAMAARGLLTASGAALFDGETSEGVVEYRYAAARAANTAPRAPMNTLDQREVDEINAAYAAEDAASERKEGGGT